MGKTLSTIAAAIGLCAAGAAYAIPSSGILPLDGGFDVYYEAIPDAPPPNFCSPGPLSDCVLTIGDFTTAAIAKVEADGTQENGGTPPYTGQVFTVTETSEGEGTWSYTAGDPAHFVTAWITKDGAVQDLLVLHYIVEDGSTAFQAFTALPGTDYPFVVLQNCGPQQDPPDFTADCDLGGLSNIVFFDTEERNPPEEVPEPASLALLGLALAGIGVVRRRRKH